MIERWLPIAGYEGLYDVSDAGRVRSAPRRGSRGGIMAHVMDGSGYPTVRLSKNDVSVRHKVHRLVCRAFHGEPQNGQEVAHLDNNRANPDATNLVWATRSENNRHKELHGTHQAGERHPGVKLTAAQVEAIRASSESGRALARLYGVNESAIRKIRSGERWRQMPEGQGSGAEGNRPNPLFLLPLLGESKMIQSDNLIERLRSLAGEIDPCFVGGRDARLLNDAADHLEGAETANAQLEHALSSLKAEVERLTEAKRIEAEQHDATLALLASAEREAEKLRERYNELLFAVARKFHGEDRHATALRYILERENASCLPADGGQALGEQR